MAANDETDTQIRILRISQAFVMNIVGCVAKQRTHKENTIKYICDAVHRCALECWSMRI